MAKWPYVATASARHFFTLLLDGSVLGAGPALAQSRTFCVSGNPQALELYRKEFKNVLT